MNLVPFLFTLHIDNEKMIPDVRKDTAGEEYIYLKSCGGTRNAFFSFLKCTKHESYNNKSDSYGLFHMNV